MKKVRFDGEDDGVPATALREIIFLKDLDHTNVVRLMDVIIEPQRLYLVFELVDMDLKHLMDSRDIPLDLYHIKSFTGQILDGLAYCHSMGVMHRDLKPQNLLVSKSLDTIKIADFGLARTFTPAGRPLTMEVITRWYRAPEILMGCQNYRCCVDLWSVGCVLAEMANKYAFLPGDSEIDQLHKIFRAFGTPTETIWPGIEQLPFWRNTFPQWDSMSLSRLVPSLDDDGWDLLQGLMQYYPPKRLSAAIAVQHAFVTDTQENLDSSIDNKHKNESINNTEMHKNENEYECLDEGADNKHENENDFYEISENNFEKTEERPVKVNKRRSLRNISRTTNNNINQNVNKKDKKKNMDNKKDNSQGKHDDRNNNYRITNINHEEQYEVQQEEHNHGLQPKKSSKRKKLL